MSDDFYTKLLCLTQVRLFSGVIISGFHCSMFGKHAPSGAFTVIIHHNKEKAEGESLLRNSSNSAVYTQCSNNTGIIVS
jgi:hypothetical protein